MTFSIEPPPDESFTVKPVKSNKNLRNGVAIGAAAVAILLVGYAIGAAGDEESAVTTAASTSTTSKPRTTTSEAERTTTTRLRPTTTTTIPGPDSECTQAFEQANRSSGSQFSFGSESDPVFRTIQVCTEDQWNRIQVQFPIDRTLADLCDSRMGIPATACGFADAAREARQIQEREQLLSSCGNVDVDAVVKNPDAFTGTCMLVYAEITQYDAATGTCQFRARWDSRAQRSWYSYEGDNAYFTSGDGASMCPALEGIDNDDVVKLWAVGEGSFSYDTQIGGNTTVPKFRVERAEIVEKN